MCLVVGDLPSSWGSAEQLGVCLAANSHRLLVSLALPSILQVLALFTGYGIGFLGAGIGFTGSRTGFTFSAL